MNRLILLLSIIALSELGCYSFKGISIPPDVTTFYVPVFEIRALNAPPAIGQQFSERLKDKIRNESRLVWNEEQPDVEFTGNIADFKVNPVAPQPGETVAINRLEIVVTVNFINHKDEKKNWKNNFTYFSDFGTDQNLLDVQEGLILVIYEQLVEDIFNKAFTDW